MHDHPDRPHPAIRTSRLETFCDGVFAIVITLLVLEIRVPAIPLAMADVELLPALLHLWPKLLSFALSFVIVGIFWVSHHQVFSMVHRTDRTFLWLNLLFLLCVTLLPFPTALMGEYVGKPIAVVPYGFTLIACGLALNAVWRYAAGRRRLVAQDLEEHLVRSMERRILLGPACYLVAVLVSLLSARWTLAIYALVPIAYLVPSPRLDRHVAHHAHHSQAS